MERTTSAAPTIHQTSIHKTFTKKGMCVSGAEAGRQAGHVFWKKSIWDDSAAPQVVGGGEQLYQQWKSGSGNFGQLHQELRRWSADILNFKHFY